MSEARLAEFGEPRGGRFQLLVHGAEIGACLLDDAGNRRVACRQLIDQAHRRRLQTVLDHLHRLGRFFGAARMRIQRLAGAGGQALEQCRIFGAQAFRALAGQPRLMRSAASLPVAAY